jgi:hypothetical protein
MVKASCRKRAFLKGLPYFLLPVAGLAQSSPPGGGTPARLPRASDVIERHIEATGGRAALQKISSRDVWARYEIPGRHLRGEVRILSARPDRLVIKTEYPDLGVAVTGFDGSVGWTTAPGARPALVRNGALADLHADALFDRYDEDNLLSAETIEIADFEGRPCVKLRIVRVPGRESFEYFDVATGLFAGSVARRETDKGAVTMRTIVSRYQLEDRVLIPHLIRIRSGGVEEIVTLMRVVDNAVSPSVFVPPSGLRPAGNP